MAEGTGEAPIGHTLRQIRRARGKSLTVVAGLAGISPSYLSRLESGERALDRRSLILTLANALEVAPGDITATAITTGGELEEDQMCARSSFAPARATLAPSAGVGRAESRPSACRLHRLRPVLSTPPPSDDPLPLSAVTTRYRKSLIALSYEHHDRANLSVGGKPQLSYRS